MTDDDSTTPHHNNMNHNANEKKETTGGKTGGIAWGGSLVGSQNPNNLGYRYSHKRYKRSNHNEEELDAQLPSNIMVEFSSRDGQSLGGGGRGGGGGTINNADGASPAMDLPMNSSVDDMGALIHALLNGDVSDDENDNNKNNNKARIPYSFYATILKNGVMDQVEVTSTLQNLVKEYQLSTEEVLKLTYQPLAVFRVKPVTRCTDTMPGHTEAILHVSYSPDGKHLASGGGDTTVRFWDPNTSLPRHTCRDHKNHVLCTAWSPDASRFASSDKNGVLILWDPSAGKALAKMQAHKQWITSMAWEPMHRNWGKCERLATCGKDGLVKVWNVRTKQCVVTMSGHTDSVECVKWGGEGLIYSASRDRSIKVWTAEDDNARGGGGGRADIGKLVRTLKGHGHRVNTLALSCDYVCRTGPFDHRGAGRFKSKEEAYQAAVEKYKEFKSGEPERMVSGSDDFTLFLWHPKDDKHPIKRLTGHQQAVNHIAFSPDGRYFASASFDKKVKIWNGKSGDFLATLTGHVGAVYQVAWSTDSRYLVSASKDSTAKLWEMPAGKRAKETLPGHADEVYALDWNPNGSSVATGSKDRTIKIWKH